MEKKTASYWLFVLSGLMGVLVFFLGQDYLAEGIALSGVKA